ncbi:hypothetical protein [Agromyces ramosus]|uniref:hypothetical protein n=1 Tax=Agromyces ramosus TaxID=33879 RepID=UPI0027D91DFB|nr:hypothetical protein [Agromyces ramosus]
MLFPGGFLIASAVLFAVLWLSEIIPDLLAGRASTSASTWEIPTNPVHVLDLAIFLPAVFLSGLLLLRRRPLGSATAPGALIFLGLTALPIMFIPFAAAARQQEPVWTILIPMSIVVAGAAVGLWLLLTPPRSHR